MGRKTSDNICEWEPNLMRIGILIAILFALAMWIGTSAGHWANKHVKPIQAEELVDIQP